jgi:hypothetical protein
VTEAFRESEASQVQMENKDLPERVDPRVTQEPQELEDLKDLKDLLDRQLKRRFQLT